MHSLSLLWKNVTVPFRSYLKLGSVDVEKGIHPEPHEPPDNLKLLLLLLL